MRRTSYNKDYTQFLLSEFKFTQVKKFEKKEVKMKFYKEDFKKVSLEQGKYYYQLKSNLIEIDIEPCAGGFCVAFYKRSNVWEDLKFIFPKKCTNHGGYDRSINGLLGERRQETWDEALKIAGELFDSFPFIP